MFRLACCFLLLAAACSLMGSDALPAAANGGPIQGTLGQPLQLGPWQVTVEPAYRTQWADAPALAVPVVLRNSSQTAQPLNSAQLFTCYRADVWQPLNLLGGAPLPVSSVASGKETSGKLLYQLPPDVLTFGLVFFWQGTGVSATGIWLLALNP